MKRIIVIVVIITSLWSCRNYDSPKYIATENEAINDIILDVTNFIEMKQLNDWPDEKLTLYVHFKLDTFSAHVEPPGGFIIAMNGTDLSESEIAENKKEYEERLARYEKERKIFKKFKDGSIKSRTLNHAIITDNLNIQLFDADTLQSFSVNKHVFGYLGMSRILFNRDFTKGHLYYSFLCGAGCAWFGNIEITKVNGQWKITENYSGGIA
jgi:hypothetical protein